MTWFRRDARIHWLDAAIAIASDVVPLLPTHDEDRNARLTTYECWSDISSR